VTAICSYCGGIDAQTLDHITARVRGGGDDPSNLAPACWSCNSSKNALSPAEWLATDRLWARIARSHQRQPRGQLALPLGSANRRIRVRDDQERLAVPCPRRSADRPSRTEAAA
jgi:HNH endonuclease